MNLGKHKKDSNIIEYILYLWHMEDVMRSFNMDIELVTKNLIPAEIDTDQKQLLAKEYSDFILVMRNESIVDKGHTSEFNEIISELAYLHQMLLSLYQDKFYQTIHQKALPNIKELQAKSSAKNLTEVETCVNGLYFTLLLRMKKKMLSDETLAAIKSFTDLLSYLGKKYHEIRAGKNPFPAEMQN
jgi:hypothetical protein